MDHHDPSQEASPITKAPNTSQNIPSVNSNLPSGDAAKLPSNPFLDSYKELNENQGDELKDFLGLLGSMGGGDDKNNMGNMTDIYDILSKLSDTPQTNPNLSKEENTKQMQILFQELLEVLLKSNMLVEPLNQIKGIVKTQLEKPSKVLTSEEKSKYESTLTYIDTILSEINKTQPDKTIILEMFNKLHELSDFDHDLFSNAPPELKDFSDLFGGNLNKK
jgi:hypothetical protein